jgi:polyisoprenoid-binding protein YceI
VRRRDVILAGGASLLPLAPAAAQSRWVFDRAASTIEMAVSAFGQSRRGRFADWSGEIVFDPDAVERTRATVTVQAASLRLTPEAAARRAVGPGFLDAARHPTIRFRLTSIRPLGGGRYDARADVTIKGRTRPVAFPVELDPAGGAARLTGAFTVDRAAFGIGGSGPFDRLVGRRATVRFDLLARPG